MSETKKDKLPLIYSCSGCSSAAQMANAVALKLDRAGTAEMSCIAGVGGDVKPLVSLAHSGRPIAVVDGCPLHCALNCLKRHGIQPNIHHTLSDDGVKKRFHADFDTGEMERAAAKVSQSVSELMATDSPSPPCSMRLRLGKK